VGGKIPTGLARSFDNHSQRFSLFNFFASSRTKKVVLLIRLGPAKREQSER
jgi:hypothetical protein